MNKKVISVLTAAIFTAIMITGCGKNNTADEQRLSKTELAVASGAETIASENVVNDDMKAVFAEDINDGVYHIQVDSSSSMFTVTDCVLAVSDGKMSAAMTMSGKGYLYVYMGTAEEAAQAQKEQYIPFEENDDGSYKYTVPVEALDKGISCAAFSKNKEIWYDRTLVFRADSLEAGAFKDGYIATVESLKLGDGVYSVDVAVEGGSGRASVMSPAKLTVESGKAYAEIIWSSSNYDYMVVNGEHFDLMNADSAGDNSTFVIPVIGFDYKMPVSADTTAMSTPHEIEYTLFFNSSTIKAESATE